MIFLAHGLGIAAILWGVSRLIESVRFSERRK